MRGKKINAVCIKIIQQCSAKGQGNPCYPWPWRFPVQILSKITYRWIMQLPKEQTKAFIRSPSEPVTRMHKAEIRVLNFERAPIEQDKALRYPSGLVHCTPAVSAPYPNAPCPHGLKCSLPRSLSSPTHDEYRRYTRYTNIFTLWGSQFHISKSLTFKRDENL